MGVDCRIMLPGNVRIRDVMTVMAGAAGFEVKRRDFGNNPGWSAKAEGVEAKTPSGSDGSYTYITFDNRHVYFTFEPDNRIGRLLYPRSTPFWAMMGYRLVDFFGGTLDINDCDAIDVDYKKRAGSNERNCPTDGDAWYAFQNRLLKVKPITLKEMEAIAPKTGYGLDSDLGNNPYSFDAKGNMIRGSRLLEAA